MLLKPAYHTLHPLLPSFVTNIIHINVERHVVLPPVLFKVTEFEESFWLVHITLNLMSDFQVTHYVILYNTVGRSIADQTRGDIFTEVRIAEVRYRGYRPCKGAVSCLVD